MRWYIVVCLVVLLIAVTWKELSAKNRRRSQSRIKDMIRKGKHFASQLKQKGTKKRGWWRSPVSKDEAQSSQKSTRRASRRKTGGRRKMQSLSSKRKSSKRHRSRHRGGSLRASSWRNTNRRKSFSKAQGRKKGTNKKTGRKNSVEGSRSKNRERNPKNKEDTRITNGLFTYKVEGDNNMLSRKFSRRTRVLGRKGGIVIGRGYDLSKRTSKQIYQTMIKAGVSKYTATNLAGAAGLTGQRAKSYIQEHLFNIVISSVQQRRLFKIMVQELEESLKKLFRYHILVKRFGKLNWKLLSHPIKEIVIDLRFRGEFMPPARRTILPSIVGNHLLEFTIHMNNRTLWKHVPRKRFELRARYLKSESRKRYSATKLKMCYSYNYCKGAPENRS